MGTEEPPVRITAEEEIQAPLNQLPPNKALRATSPVILADIHGYEVRPRKDRRGVDLISDVLLALHGYSGTAPRESQCILRLTQRALPQLHMF